MKHTGDSLKGDSFILMNIVCFHILTADILNYRYLKVNFLEPENLL